MNSLIMELYMVYTLFMVSEMCNHLINLTIKIIGINFGNRLQLNRLQLKLFYDDKDGFTNKKLQSITMTLGNRLRNCNRVKDNYTYLHGI